MLEMHGFAKKVGFTANVFNGLILTPESIEKLRAQAKIEQIEAENEAFHAATGGLVECKCCFSDCPVNRMISCTGDEAHFFCSTCIKKNVETQIGYMRYEISCVDTSQCKAGFSPTGLAEIIGTALVKKLDDLRQRDELDKAGIEGLEECPFCNFKAICPPLEEDREFRCMGPDCGKTSCRLCKLESHVPRTCEEITKERGVDARHQIEEAMTKAIVRICPNSRCKMPMIKDEGCNNLTCSKCQSRLCYVCKKDITKIAYNHFSRRPDSCQLYDQDEKVNRHYLEAVKAQQEATEEVLKANPQLQQKDIAVELPDKAPSRPRQRDNPFNDLLPNIGNIPWMGNDGRFPARVYQEAARRQPVQLAPAPPPDAQVPPFPNIPIPDPFLDMIPWPPTPRLAPAVPANIQQAQNAPPNLNPAAQLRQRLYEEQRFQRNRFMGTIPAVPQGNVPIAPRPEPRQPLHDHQLQFNSFAQNLAANMGPFPHPNPFMAQRADPPDARPPRKRFIVKKNF